MNDKELAEFCKNQIELEAEIIKISQESAKNIKNALIKEMIISITIDSTKHRSMLSAIIGMLEEPTPFIDEEKRDELAKNVEKHIQLEAKAIETYKKLLDELENERAKVVIKEIYNDEKRHHKMLKRIQKNLVEKETFDVEDAWETYYQDSVSHGSPGG